MSVLATQLFLTALAASAHAAEPLFERELLATGTVSYEDTGRLPPTDDAPLWIEVAVYRNPIDATCLTDDCPPKKVGDHVWTGPAEIGDDGTWTASLTRGPRALPVTKAVPPVELRHDYAVRVTAWLGTTPERCFSYCAAQARVHATHACTEAHDPLHCRAGEHVRTRDACELACNGPESWALAGTTWITSGDAHATMTRTPATLVAPRVELEQVVDPAGNPVVW